ncbi:MAG: hypothetical protein KME32_07050 [Mojavia pulchra JT2-VF2]|uniref:Uncharacterized protein n=1 Tax=Mojavia pulchra JT2-VF2 TaxID=287848 RepID=A0A951PXG0_9NOST|nr:hypothetical protein [Mojavia pulchra JT2-VF2]
MKPFIYKGSGVSKLMFGITGLSTSGLMYFYDTAKWIARWTILSSY